MTRIDELIEGGYNVTLSINAGDLEAFGRYLIESTKAETKRAIKANEEDCLLTVNEVMSQFKIKDRTSLWRWAKRGYLEPVRVGGKTLYRTSDIEEIIKKKRGGER